MLKPTIEKLIPLAKTSFLSLYDATYKNKKGQERHWMIASRKNEKHLRQHYFDDAQIKDDAVVLVALHQPTQSLVLLKQFRIPLNDFVYELPAGLIDEGEEALNTVSRELKEETGLELLEIKRTQSQLYLSPGMTDESVTLVYCTCTGEVSTDYLEADEVIEPILVSKAMAKKLLSQNEKLDVKIYLILQQFICDLLAF